MACCSNPLRLASAALMLAVLAGCSAWPDAHEARTCRTIAPAINPPGSTIEVSRTAALPHGGGVAVDYAARAPGAALRLRRIVCRFAAEGGRAPGDRLVEVWSDGQRLGDIRLALLKRFWLQSVDSLSADPAPFLQLGAVPEVPRTLALALQHVVAALPLIAIYAVLAPAYSLIYGLLGRINLAFGEFAAIGGYGALLASAMSWGLGFWPALLALSLGLGVFSAGIHGFAAGRLVFAPLQRASGQQVLIATIGLAIAMQEYMRLSQGSALRWVEPFLNNPVALARSGSFVVAVTPIAGVVAALALAAALGLLALMRWTRFGRCWRACADDPTAAMLVGVDVRGVLAGSLILSAALAGLAGTIVTVYYGGVGYAGGIVLGLKSLIAAIAGGIDSIPGSFLGAILVGGAEALWSALFPIEYRDMAIYGMLAALLIWRPGGLLGAGSDPSRQIGCAARSGA